MITEVNGATRLCGLIGYPVKHTLSPVIHNYLAGELGHNLVYVPFEVAKDVDSAVRGAFALNVLGMNVTVPYKKEVMDSLLEIDVNAQQIGAVNTLVRMERGYKGYNTDYLGLKRALESEQISLAGENVVVLGAGGAANAVVYLCAQSGAGHIYLLNRTFETARALAERVGAFFKETDITPMALSDYAKLPQKQMIAIQTTSVGLAPHGNCAPIEDESFYKQIKTAVDIIYNPQETVFMKKVRQQGGLAYNGLKMLLYQGVTAYELWNDAVVDETVCNRVLELLKQQF